MKKIKELIVLSVLSCGIVLGTFEPTNEWQPIAEDEQLPPGLHVRLNINSGLREAKLISPDDDDGNDNNNIESSSHTGNDSTESEIIVVELNDDGGLSSDDSDLDQGLKNIKSQLYVQHDLMEKMADLAHDIDYGTIIVNSALPELVNIILNPEHDPEFRDCAARALGASLYNNPAALTILFDSKIPVIPKLLKRLQLEHDPKFQSRILYILSSCLSDDRATDDFIKADGGAIIRELFVKGGSSFSQIYKKCCDLIQDQIIDRESPNSDSEHSEWRTKELQEWSQIFQRILVKNVVNADIDIKYVIFQTLVNIREQSLGLTDIPIRDEFLEWLAFETDKLSQEDKKMKKKKRGSSESESEPESLKPEDELNIEDQYLAELKRTRHVVFGNPKAARKHAADDL